MIASSKIVLVLVCAASSFGAIACGGGSSTPPPTAPTPNAPTLTAPTIDGPAGDLQLDTLRPTLSVFNGTSNQAGTRTYEFQISDGDAFSNITLTRAGVAEGANGRTSFTPDQDLQPATRLYWRARMAQGSTVSGWSPTGLFRTRQVGYNRSGELYDPLVHGETVGTRVGATSFVSGKGLRIENSSAFVRYQLPQTISAGEFSVEVEGLRPNGPDHKLKIMSMFDGPGNLIGSRYESAVHYRGVNGNPDNCISFKTVWGDQAIRLEPDFGQRLAAVRTLDPAATYLVQALWTSNSFRVVVKQGGVAGSLVFDLTINAPPGTGPYTPTPHYAYLGATSGLFGSDAGSWPGATYRNVWISTRARPTSLGSATHPLP